MCSIPGLNLSQQPKSKPQQMIDRANARLQVADDERSEEMELADQSSQRNPVLSSTHNASLHDDISEITDITQEVSKHAEEDGEEVYA